MSVLPLLTPDLYTKLYNDIVELRNALNLPVNVDRPLDADELRLHVKVFRSEFKELATAKTPLLQLDGIVDSVVTLMQRVVHAGNRPFAQFQGFNPGISFLIEELLVLAEDLKFDFVGAWDEIQRSNLSKVCTTEDEAKQTQDYYTKEGVATVAEPTIAGWVVKVAEDSTLKGEEVPRGKFLKSVSYSKPDLKPFI